MGSVATEFRSDLEVYISRDVEGGPPQGGSMTMHPDHTGAAASDQGPPSIRKRPWSPPVLTCADADEWTLGKAPDANEHTAGNGIMHGRMS